jgi:hypothetical protein
VVPHMFEVLLEVLFDVFGKRDMDRAAMAGAV